MRFRNATEAFLAKLEDIASDGLSVQVRGHLTREILNQTLTLEKPLERCIVVPERRNNIFAAIAETIWVIAGRNDLSFLGNYLPRSSDFSDDGGLTWRAAYGPRLRAWHGSVDQVDKVVRLLAESESSRRAVISLYDPDVDFRESNDIPCTNWLHFTVRDGALNLGITVRSNDLIWGFSGINTFEWSVLQEMVAHWLGKSVGETTFFISSLHIYDTHYLRGSRILAHQASAGTRTEQHGIAQFSTKFEALPETLSDWFKIEKSIRVGNADRTAIANFSDPLLRDFLKMLDAYWAFRNSDEPQARHLIQKVHDPDLITAGESYFDWKGAPPEIESTQKNLSLPQVTGRQVEQFILEVHQKSVANDGDRWRYQGTERYVQANTVLAFERLMYRCQSPSEPHRLVFSAAVELFISSLNHEIYLDRPAEEAVSSAAAQRSHAPLTFERLVRKYKLGVNFGETFDQDILAVQLAFKRVEDREHANQRIDRIKDLSSASARLVSGLMAKDSESIRRLIRRSR